MFNNIHYFLNDDSYETHLDKKTKYDVVEKEDKYIIQVDSAGYNKKNIDISVEKDRLKITFNEREDIYKDEEYYYQSIPYDKKTLTFKIPDEVDKDKINSTLDIGILTINMNKEKKSIIKKIDIA